MNWWNDEIVLNGNVARLEPLSKNHIASLLECAQDKRIWEHYVFDGTEKDKLREKLLQALDERQKGTQYPFVIVSNESGRIIGSTRLMDIVASHHKAEIGWTWLHPCYWRTAVNTECKLLLLQLCFEQLHMLRVTLKTDALNTRSRNAIQRIGASFEGILRNDMVRDNGTSRDSAYYSIIATEWVNVKARLIQLLQGYPAVTGA